ncbi:bifunctional DNA-binding transcriptional regulator/O6-methylguanine-DNA methyltransferase Ada [Enterobacterales bacterium AW_CKDN230030176-1A_HGKHYDSX7]
MPSSSAYSTDSQRWQAVVTRDQAAVGQFVYAVLSTGIYCLPGCAARTPRRDNVVFFDDPDAAAQAGYRACQRCWPCQAPADWVAQACRLLEADEVPLGLHALSARFGLSVGHVQRRFKADTGLTPKAYADACRARRLQQALIARQGSVTEAIHAAGYGSSSRVYGRAQQRLGMQPRQVQRKGAGMTVRFAIGQCSLGAILVAQSEQGICAIWLEDDADTLLRQVQERFAQAELVGGDAAFEQVVAEVVGFVEQPALGLHLPLDIRGTAFQERVWQALRALPMGARVSYRDIATRIGAPSAVRAVAKACAANRLAVAIPCHRVVRSDGALSGYRWGLERKRALLEREAEAP